MDLLSQTEFASRAGCTQAAISAAVIRGRLVWSYDETGRRGIDADDPLSVAYLKNSAIRTFELATDPARKSRAGRPRRDPNAPPRTRKPRAGAETPAPETKPAAPDPGQPQAFEAPEPIPMPPPRQRRANAQSPISIGHAVAQRIVDDREREREYQLRILALKASKARHEELVRTKKLIPAVQVDRAWGKLGAALEENFRSFADRHAPPLAAMAAAGAGEIQIHEYLMTEIEVAVARTMVMVDREIEKSAKAETGVDA